MKGNFQVRFLGEGKPAMAFPYPTSPKPSCLATRTLLKLCSPHTSRREQKALGRKVRGFDLDTWKAKRESIVYVGCREKFAQHPGLRTLLLATAPTELVEASPYDLIWGVGLGEHHPDITDKSKWRGQNLLGQALMKVRDTLSS